MNDGRMYATATLLNDGKVLIAGGISEWAIQGLSPVLASAELYDPATSKFTPTGSMIAARGYHTATLLPDGRVLIAGGYGCGSARTCSQAFPIARDRLVSAELYDPTTGQFSATGSMSTPRAEGTATLLADGRVLLASGTAGSQAVELYDPASGNFTRAGSLVRYSNGVSAILLPSGKVLLIGPEFGPKAELYDPANGRSASLTLDLLPGAGAVANPPVTAETPRQPRYLGTVASFCVYSITSSHMTPGTGSFTQPGSISSSPGQWIAPTATLLSDGRVLFAGGYLDHGSGLQDSASSAGLYDPATGKFTPTGTMTTAGGDHTATLLPDGTVLIAGGTAQGGTGTALSSAELFRP